MLKCALVILGVLLGTASDVRDHPVNAAWAQFTATGSGVPIVQPTLAAAHGYNTNLLNETFASCSTIDTSNTGNPGFNWYLRNAVATFPALGFSNSTLLCGAGGLQLGANSISTGGATADTSLISAYWTSGTTLVGNTYPSGTGISFFVQWQATPSQAPASCSRWPVVWSTGSDVLTNTSPENPPFVEMDISEKFCSSAGNTTNDGNLFTWDSVLCAPGNNCEISPVNYPPADASLHSYELLWVPTAANGGTGEFLYAYDGVQQNSMTQTYTSSGAPAASPNVPGIFYNVLDISGQNMVVQIRSGENQPVTITKVQVWVH